MVSFPQTMHESVQGTGHAVIRTLFTGTPVPRCVRGAKAGDNRRQDRGADTGKPGP